MSINAQGITAQRDRPLTRADVEIILQEVGNSNKLNLSGRNMAGIDLKKLILREADLTGADLTGAILDKANLTKTIPISERLTKSDTINTRSTSTFRILIIEEPLTPYNLTTIISSLTELSTMYWLIAKGRFSDLIEYSQTHNVQFAEEAKLVITKITYNSPFSMDWKIDLSAPSIAEGINTTLNGK